MKKKLFFCPTTVSISCQVVELGSAKYKAPLSEVSSLPGWA